MIPVHQWTSGGDEVLILRCGDVGYEGFQWPTEVGAKVMAPDWNPKPECGGGLHGWPWGLAMGDGQDPKWDATWIVFGAVPADVIDLGGKVKARSATVRFAGTWHAAMLFVLSGKQKWVKAAARGAASATGARGAASATGLYGRVMAGPFGCVAVAWWNDAEQRHEMLCAQVGCGDGSDG